MNIISVSSKSTIYAFFKKMYAIFPFKKNFFQVLRIFNVPSFIYQHLWFKGTFKVKVNQKQSFLVNHYGFQVENEIFWKGIQGKFEKVSLQYWIKLSQRSQVILDIGANTGIYSLVAKAVNPEGDIYAFEPVNRVYLKLVENCCLNQYNIKCFELAISNLDGEATIYDLETEHIYSVTVNENNTPPGMKAIPITIQTKKLSTFIEETHIPKIDLIKIDVESHEPVVIESLGKYLEIMKPTLLVEVWNDEIGKTIEDMVKNKSYQYFFINELDKPIQTERIQVSLDGLCDRQPYVNYLICQPSVARQLELI